MNANISFTYPKAVRLQRAYRQALEDNQPQFTFEGHEYLCDYVRYLLDYLADLFGKPIGE